LKSVIETIDVQSLGEIAIDSTSRIELDEKIHLSFFSTFPLQVSSAGRVGKRPGRAHFPMGGVFLNVPAFV
jgi:hypothetical protein